MNPKETIKIVAEITESKKERFELMAAIKQAPEATTMCQLRACCNMTLAPRSESKKKANAGPSQTPVHCCVANRIEIVASREFGKRHSFGPICPDTRYVLHNDRAIRDTVKAPMKKNQSVAIYGVISLTAAPMSSHTKERTMSRFATGDRYTRNR